MIQKNIKVSELIEVEQSIPMVVYIHTYNTRFVVHSLADSKPSNVCILKHPNL